MKIQVTFSTIVDCEEDLTRNGAFDVADYLAAQIASKSGVVLEVYDVDPVEEY
jgi:hypothetical protein